MKKKFIFLGLVLGLAAILLVIKPALSPIVEKPQWQTYENNKFGFRFSYPFSWQKEEWDLETATGYKNISDGTILYQGKFFSKDTPPVGSFEVLIWENNSRAKILNWLTWFRHEDLTLSALPIEENDSVAKMPAVRYFQPKTARGTPVLYYFFTKENLVFELTEEREDLVNLTKEEATQSAQFFSPIYDPILQIFSIDSKFLPKENQLRIHG